MRAQGGKVLRLAIPLKVMAQRFAFLVLVALSAGLLVLGKADVAVMERARDWVTDAAAPVMGWLARPVAATNRLIDEINNLITLREENARLREENRRLRRWEAAARRLEQETIALRGLLRVQAEPEVAYISARVIGDSGGPFVRTLLLNAGRRAGVRKGQAAVTGAGLVGRIAAAGERSSRILLITDLNSRVPVVVESSRYRAVLAGDNSARPRLSFLPASAQLSPGDRIVTSGDGGLFPPGLPVGVVSDVADRVVRVQPYVDWSRIEMVRVLRFDLPRFDGAEDDAGMVGAGP